MLLRLMICRLLPVALLRLCRDRRVLKLTAAGILAVAFLCLSVAVRKIFLQEQWLGLVCVLFAGFPQGIFYGFSLWILVRCIWNVWSERVWRRIHSFAMLGMILGILMENYANPYVLQIFFKFLK